MDKAVEFVLSCMNFDGGFGCRPGSESHAGQVRYLRFLCPFSVFVSNALSLSHVFLILSSDLLLHRFLVHHWAASSSKCRFVGLVAL